MSKVESRLEQLSRQIFSLTMDELVASYSVEELTALYHSADHLDSMDEMTFDNIPSCIYPTLFRRMLKQEKYQTLTKQIKMLSKLGVGEEKRIPDYNGYVDIRLAKDVDETIGYIIQTEVLATLIGKLPTAFYKNKYSDALATLLAIYREYDIDLATILTDKDFDYYTLIDNLSFNDNVIKVYGTLLLPDLLDQYRSGFTNMADATEIILALINGIETSPFQCHSKTPKKEAADLIWR